MACLYDPRVALPIDRRGHSPMQPACAKRIDRAGALLLKGVSPTGTPELVRDAIEDLGPLFACQKHNGALPCARACCVDANLLMRIIHERIQNF